MDGKETTTKKKEVRESKIHKFINRSHLYQQPHKLQRQKTQLDQARRAELQQSHSAAARLKNSGSCQSTAVAAVAAAAERIHPAEPPEPYAAPAVLASYLEVVVAAVEALLASSSAAAFALASALPAVKALHSFASGSPVVELAVLFAANANAE
jgi:hypothetical protein